MEGARGRGCRYDRICQGGYPSVQSYWDEVIERCPLFGLPPKMVAFAMKGYIDPKAFLKYIVERGIWFLETMAVAESLVI
jgi:hypothetical protein